MGKDELMRLAEDYADASFGDGTEYQVRGLNDSVRTKAAESVLESAITSALASAHAAGRRDGLEEAAAMINPEHSPATRLLHKLISALIDSPTTKGAV